MYNDDSDSDELCDGCGRWYCVCDEDDEPWAPGWADDEDEDAEDDLDGAGVEVLS